MCGPVYAQDNKTQQFIDNDTWRFFGTSASGIEYHTKGVVKKSNIYDFWVKMDSPPLEECKGNPFSKSPIDNQICETKKNSSIKQQISHIYIDCKTKKSNIQETVFYSYQDTVLGSDDKPNKIWGTIFPDTMVESLYKTLCK